MAYEQKGGAAELSLLRLLGLWIGLFLVVICPGLIDTPDGGSFAD